MQVYAAHKAESEQKSMPSTRRVARSADKLLSDISEAQEGSSSGDKQPVASSSVTRSSLDTLQAESRPIEARVEIESSKACHSDARRTRQKSNRNRSDRSGRQGKPCSEVSATSLDRERRDVQSCKRTSDGRPPRPAQEKAHQPKHREAQKQIIRSILLQTMPETSGTGHIIEHGNQRARTLGGVDDLLELKIQSGPLERLAHRSPSPTGRRARACAVNSELPPTRKESKPGISTSRSRSDAISADSQLPRSAQRLLDFETGPYQNPQRQSHAPASLPDTRSTSSAAASVKLSPALRCEHMLHSVEYEDPGPDPRASGKAPEQDCHATEP